MERKRKLQLKAEIIYNKEIKPGFWHCALNAPLISGESIPGQFVNIRLTSGLQPLLRRPFSIHRVNGHRIEVMYQVLGEGTRLFAKQRAGISLDIIGPLGNGFTIPSKSIKKRIILVAGGMGVAPLVFLAQRLGVRKNTVLIGARTKEQLLCEKDFIDAGCSVKIATDDGSRGFKGYVSELLKKELSAVNCQPSTVYACGPKPMLKEVAGITKRCRVSAQLSLEEHMACGIGACLGCVVNTRGGFKRVCKEGPVFEADELIW